MIINWNGRLWWDLRRSGRYGNANVCLRKEITIKLQRMRVFHSFFVCTFLFYIISLQSSTYCMWICALTPASEKERNTARWHLLYLQVIEVHKSALSQQPDSNSASLQITKCFGTSVTHTQCRYLADRLFPTQSDKFNDTFETQYINCWTPMVLCNPDIPLPPPPYILHPFTMSTLLNHRLYPTRCNYLQYYVQYRPVAKQTTFHLHCIVHTELFLWIGLF